MPVIMRAICALLEGALLILRVELRGTVPSNSLPERAIAF